MEEIKMTQEELDAKIKEAVEKATAEKEAEFKKTHDTEMAQLRLKAKAEKEEAVKKAQEEANLTAEEKAKKKLEEEQKAKEDEYKAEHEELEQLRLEKKVHDRAEKLVKVGLPNFLKNDMRLLNADDDKVDEVINTIKAEYDEANPKKANIDTNVHGGEHKSPEQAELERVRMAGLGKY